MQLLAQQAGMEIKKIEFDSGPYHLWASEQYKNDIALMEPGSYMINKQVSSFSENQIKNYTTTAQKTNRDGEGDQAAFYLYVP